MSFKRAINRAIKDAGFDKAEFEVGRDEFTYRFPVGLTGSLDERPTIEAGNAKLKAVADRLTAQGYDVLIYYAGWGGAYAALGHHRHAGHDLDYNHTASALHY